jgi:hypothetical protein
VDSAKVDWTRKELQTIRALEKEFDELDKKIAVERIVTLFTWPQEVLEQLEDDDGEDVDGPEV